MASLGRGTVGTIVGGPGLRRRELKPQAGVWGIRGVRGFGWRRGMVPGLDDSWFNDFWGHTFSPQRPIHL